MPVARFLKACFVVIFVCITPAGYAACSDVYSCAVDSRWPMVIPMNIDDQLIRLIVIRKIPGDSLYPEEYAIIRVREHAIEVEYSKPPSGASLMNQMRKLISDGRTDADDLAKGLVFTTTRVESQRKLKPLIDRFDSLRFRASLPPALHVDATRYEISESTLMNSLYLSMYDSSVGPRNELVDWAKDALAIFGSSARVK